MSRTPNSGSLLPGRLHATGEVNGFQIRPGLFLSNGATLVPGGVSFTILFPPCLFVSILSSYSVSCYADCFLSLYFCFLRAF